MISVSAGDWLANWSPSKGLAVRLWVDDLHAFACICPELDVQGQTADFINIVAFDRAGEFAEKYFRQGMRNTRKNPDRKL